MNSKQKRKKYLENKYKCNDKILDLISQAGFSKNINETIELVPMKNNLKNFSYFLKELELNRKNEEINIKFSTSLYRR